MSKRIDLKNQIFSDTFVLEFEKEENTHAKWKCLCMRCNEVFYVTASNLKSGHTKSCQSCGQKKCSNGLAQEIWLEIKKGEKITSIANKHGVDRKVVYRIKKEFEV